MSRLILKKLIFIGTDKEPAYIDFAPGFNVISGPSDTGKTLIYECLNYALGSGKRPKEPPEAKGYTNLFLTIASEHKDFTIERSVLSNDIKIYDTGYDGITKDTKSSVISGNAKSKDSISDYLLKIIGIYNKKLKKNESNETISLTFNVLKNLILVDEGKIQAKTSPILTDVPTSATSEKALFRFMLTGIDYSNVIVQQKPEVRKADANARINVLNYLIRNNTLNLEKDVSTEDLEEQLTKLEKTIENEITKISASHREIEELQKERKLAWNTAISSESKIDQLKEILSRFTLLAQHYQTDLDRLDAIIETGEALSLTADVLCPLCGSKPEYHRSECIISEKEIDSVKVSCEYEKKKIHSLQSDLSSTINQVKNELNSCSSLKQENENEYKRIDKLLSEKLEPSVIRLKDQLRNLFNTKKDVEIMIGIMGQIKEMEELKASAEQDLKPRPKQEKAPVGVQAAEVNELLKVIESTLKNWCYPDLDRVGFSEDKQDITIGNKNRADQGKGYRAITHAAFIISLMEFCINNEKPHPGFVVLDSPLVTFRGANKGIKADEAITDDMKMLFYTSLCNLNKDRQIIVIENDDPPISSRDKMNYIHFTKDKSVGRYGFLPINNK
jgi:AAA domain